MTQLGRSGAALETLRRADLEGGEWKPGPGLATPQIPAGSALCASMRPVRRFKMPEAQNLRVLVPFLPWPEGEAVGSRFERIERRGRLSEWAVELSSKADANERFFDWLAALHAPALGDLRRGGILVEGGLRVRDAAEEQPEGWWPEEPLVASPKGTPPPLAVSKATLRALQSGHPWVLPDRELGDLRVFAPGQRVVLVGPSGREGGEARVDGEGRVAARRWRGPREAARSVPERLEQSIDRREGFLKGHDARDGTDAYRLVHGEADGLPGLAVDRLGDWLRVHTSGRAALEIRSEVTTLLEEGLGGRLPKGLARIEVLQLETEGAKVRAVEVGPLSAEVPDAWVVREGDLRFQVELGWKEPFRPRPGFGLFLDQRENRRKLRGIATGGCYANLFAHTGSFSAALLAGGAEAVYSVDLSAAYLEGAEVNLALCGLTGGHHSVRSDARRFLETDTGPEQFDGLVIDPPTAAAAGRHYWSVRKDLKPLLVSAFRRLAPGGWLLVTRNDRGRRDRLEDLVQQAASTAQVRVGTIEDAPPAADFPRLLHFPEGDAFEGIFLRRD